MKKTILALAFAVASPFAFANGYVGGGYSFLDYAADDLSSDLSLDALSVRGGYQFHEYLTVEGRVGIGMGDDALGGAKLEMDHYLGAYVKAGMPIHGFYPYILLGMTYAKLTISAVDGSFSDSGSDLSYGIGLDYYLNDQVSLNAEYANMYDKGGVKIDGFTIGAAYHF